MDWRRWAALALAIAVGTIAVLALTRGPEDAGAGLVADAVRAERPRGWTPATSRSFSDAEAEDALAEQAAAVIQGRVEDVTGGAIEGAIVSAGTNHSVESGDDGSFTLRLPRGRHTLTAIADGYAQGRVRTSAPGSVNVQLVPASAIEGRVVDQRGEPVAGATVTARTSLDPFAHNRGATPELTTVSAQDGRFRLDHLSPGLYAINAHAGSLYGTAEHSVALGFGETASGIVVTVRTVPVVRGRVVIASTSEPCARGRVRLVNDSGGFEWMGTIDPSGEVAIAVASPGTYVIAVECDGHRIVGDPPSMIIGDADPPLQTWTVDKGATIGVFVFGDDGPIGGASVEAVASGAGDGYRRRTHARETDRDGSARISGLRAGPYAVTAHASGYAPMAESLAVDAPADGIRIRLTRGGRILGTVIDERDVPVPDVTVHTRISRGSGASVYAETDALGRFELEGVAAGARTVYVLDRSELPVPASTIGRQIASERVNVERGETTEVTLRIRALDGVIEGRVVDRSGAAVTDALVVARRDRGNTGLALRAVYRLRTGKIRTMTDADGHFRLERLAPGTYAVRALRRGPGGEAARAGVATGSTVTLTIGALASVEGTVVQKEGSNAPIFWVQLERRGMKWRRAELHTDGTFKMTGIAPGTYALGVKAAGGDGSRVIELAEGQALTGIEFELNDYATIRGRAVDFDTGEPVPGYRAIAQDAKGGTFSPMWKNITDADGRFEIRSAPAGRVTLHIVPAGRLVSSHGGGHQTHDVVAGEVNDVGEIRLARDRRSTGEPIGLIGFTVGFWDHEADQIGEHVDVTTVEPSGPAALAGLRPGDRIVAVDGVDVTGNGNHLFYQRIKTAPGTALVLSLARDVDITLVTE